MAHDASVLLKIAVDLKDFKKEMEHMKELAKKAGEIMVEAFKKAGEKSLEGLKKLGEGILEIGKKAAELLALGEALSLGGLFASTIHVGEAAQKYNNMAEAANSTTGSLVGLSAMFDMASLSGDSAGVSITRLQNAIAGGGEEAQAALSQINELKKSLSDLEKSGAPELVSTKNLDPDKQRDARRLNAEAIRTGGRPNSSGLMQEFGIGKAEMDAYRAKFQKFKEEKAKIQGEINDQQDIATSGKKAFKRLGMDPEELMGMKGTEQFRTVLGEISKLESHEDKIRTLRELFGKSGPALMPLVNNFKELDEKAQSFYGHVAKLMDRPGAANFMDDWADTFIHKTKAASLELGGSILNSMMDSSGAESLLKIFSNSHLGEALGNQIGPRLAGLADLIDEGLKNGNISETITGLVSVGFQYAIEVVSGPIREMFENVKTYTAAVFNNPGVWDSISRIGLGLIEIMKSAGVQLVVSIDEAISKTGIGSALNLGSEFVNGAKYIAGNVDAAMLRSLGNIASPLMGKDNMYSQKGAEAQNYADAARYKFIQAGSGNTSIRNELQEDANRHWKNAVGNLKNGSIDFFKMLPGGMEDGREAVRNRPRVPYANPMDSVLPHIDEISKLTPRGREAMMQIFDGVQKNSRRPDVNEERPGRIDDRAAGMVGGISQTLTSINELMKRVDSTLTKAILA